MIIKLKKEKAQGLVEYAISVALVSIAVMGIMSAMGPAVDNSFNKVNESLQDRGFELIREGDDEDDEATPTPTTTSIPESTSTPTPTPTPEPTATSTPTPTPTPTSDACVALREAYTAAANAYLACGGGWGCWSEYSAALSAYYALRNAGCE
jgi:Flp pilus assembly pilin Flp